MRNRWALALLLTPFVALVYPAWYNHIFPTLGGLPFFVWYQLLWIVLVAPLMAAVWLLTRTQEDDPA
jgi:hypothetical protein